VRNQAGDPSGQLVVGERTGDDLRDTAVLLSHGALFLPTSVRSDNPVATAKHHAVPEHNESPSHEESLPASCPGTDRLRAQRSFVALSDTTRRNNPAKVTRTRRIVLITEDVVERSFVCVMSVTTLPRGRLMKRRLWS